MSGPNCPVSKAFIWCGWRTLSVDWVFGHERDFCKIACQESISQQLQEACFLTVAMDCSTKSRAREIKRTTRMVSRCLAVSSFRKGFQGCHCRTSSVCPRTISHVRLCWTKCSSWLSGVEGPSGRIPPTACIELAPAAGEAAEGVRTILGDRIRLLLLGRSSLQEKHNVEESR